MRSLIISDLHSEHPQSAIERALEAGIKKVVCLGDIEIPQIMKYLLDLKIKKRIIIGDHEYHHCHGLEIYSSSMNHDYKYYQDLWEDFPREREVVIKYGKIENGDCKLKKGIKVIDEINGKKVCYVHGSLLKEEPRHPNTNGIMWGRLLRDYSNERKRMNFEKMKEQNIQVLFRGHDHHSEVYSINANENPNKAKIESDYSAQGIQIKLENDKLYIVSVGAFEKGVCAVFDEDKFMLEYTNTGFFRR